MNFAFLVTVSTFGLHHFVELPTRGDNVVDLLHSNCPEVLQDACTLPGISDHEIVVAHVGSFFLSALVLFPEMRSCMIRGIRMATAPLLTFITKTFRAR